MRQNPWLDTTARTASPAGLPGLNAFRRAPKRIESEDTGGSGEQTRAQPFCRIRQVCYASGSPVVRRTPRYVLRWYTAEPLRVVATSPADRSTVACSLAEAIDRSHAAAS